MSPIEQDKLIAETHKLVAEHDWYRRSAFWLPVRSAALLLGVAFSAGLLTARLLGWLS